MRTIRLTVAYDGRAYCGWQLQENGPTIQGALEAAWLAVTGESVRIASSGRTDAGVHARGQVCSLTSQSVLECRVLQRALNANLPPDIAVLEAAEAAQGFHATRDALCKTYQYRVVAGRVRDVFERDRAWFVPEPLDISAIQRAAPALVGRHDFAAFQSTGSARLSSVRTVFRLTVEAVARDGRQYVDISVSANGFLYNMVRIISGSLVLVGKGRHPPGWLAEVLHSRDRTLAGPTAPACGLCLMSVCYDAGTVCEAGACPGWRVDNRGPGLPRHGASEDDE